MINQENLDYMSNKYIDLGRDLEFYECEEYLMEFIEFLHYRYKGMLAVQSFFSYKDGYVFIYNTKEYINGNKDNNIIGKKDIYVSKKGFIRFYIGN